MATNYFQNYMRAVTQPLPEMERYFSVENDFLAALVDRESIVLDVGCGNGRTMKSLSPLVGKIVGLDHDRQMTEAAEKLLRGLDNIQLITEDFFNWETEVKFDLTFGSYNLLGSSEVDPQRRSELLGKMISVTKQGGFVLASVWSDKGIEFARKYYPYIDIQVLDIRNNQVFTDHGIFRRFTKNELIELVMPFGKIHEVVELADLFYCLKVAV